jgi:hypothetical protein
VGNPIGQMTDIKKFEILDALPTYGPMYVPVTEDGKPYYSEGFVVRFFKSTGDNWVANFKLGFKSFSDVFDFKDSENLVVIAGGLGYVMHPDNEKPIRTFGCSIEKVIRHDEEKLIASDDTQIIEITANGDQWISPRIAWDGIKDIKIENGLLTGLSFDPMDDNNEWVPFSINLTTKQIESGSYRRYYTDNGQPIKKNKWWKVW